jgi:hypothetical protein
MVARFSCHTAFVSSKNHLRKVTVTLEEAVATWVRVEARRRDISVSQLVGEVLKDRMPSQDGVAAEIVQRLANFGKSNRLSAGGLKTKNLMNEGRR